MNTKVNIYPVLVTWKANKKTGECPLHLSVDLNNKKISFPSLKRKLLPIYWDEEKKRVKSNHPFAAVINSLIDKRKMELQAEFDKMEILGTRINKERAKKVAKGIKAGMDYYKFAQDEIDARKYAPDTKRSYETEITKMRKFAPTLSFADITYQFLQAYAKYMRNELHNQDNTVWKTFKFHNTMLIAAGKVGGLIQQNPFDEFNRSRYSQGIPDYLEWHEFQKVKTVVLSDDSLTYEEKRCGMRFLLGCVAGFRFRDLARFTYDSFVIQEGKGRRLLLYAHKNKEIVSIAFTDDIAAIVDALKDDPPLEITNQEFNRAVRLIGGIAKIGKSLKSHMGRHTFGMRCAELGMSIDDTQKLLGHRDRNSTLIYFRIKNARLDSAMEAWNK